MRYKTNNVVNAVTKTPLDHNLTDINLHNRLKERIIEHLKTFGEYCTPKQIQKAIEAGGADLKAEI